MRAVESQLQKAESLHALHHGQAILILVNAWDVASARIVEEAGFSAIATSSAGIAFSLGYPDGQRISRTEMLEQVGRIACQVKLPVTADVESGYGSKPDDAAQTARDVIACGAVGINLEDALDNGKYHMADLSLQLEKLRAVREVAAKAGIPLLLNARTDVYLEKVGPPETRYDMTVKRLAAFRDSGADCVFAPGLQDPQAIGRLVRDLACPLNILAGPGSPSIPELHALGVARVSLGSGPMRASLGYLRGVAEEISGPGTYTTLADGIPYSELNQLMAGNS
jgi:2-methylisocitrate lyase-like PEP mutase family enzyme